MRGQARFASMDWAAAVPLLGRMTRKMRAAINFDRFFPPLPPIAHLALPLPLSLSFSVLLLSPPRRTTLFEV